MSPVLLACVVSIGVLGAFARQSERSFGSPCDATDQSSQWRRNPFGNVVTSIGVVLVVIIGLTIVGPLHLVTGVLVGVSMRKWTGQRAHRRRQGEREQQLAVFLESLTHQLRAGKSIRAALDACAELAQPVAGELAPLVGAKGLVAASREWAATYPPGSVAHEIDRSLRFAMHSGTPVINVLTDVQDRRYRSSEIFAEARSLSTQATSSAVMLAALPVMFTVVIGLLDPSTLTMLATTTGGGVILLVGAALQLCGVAWMMRIADSARVSL